MRILVLNYPEKIYESLTEYRVERSRINMSLVGQQGIRNYSKRTYRIEGRKVEGIEAKREELRI